MFRPWVLLALSCLFAPACAGEEFTSTEASNSSNFTGSSGKDATGGSNAQGGAGRGGAQAVSASAGEPGTGGEPGADPVHACRDLPEGTANGTYLIDPDGTGPIAAFEASCLFDSSGGWTLILNYVHKGGTNPALAVRKDSLPLLGSETLGVDESALTKNWGHASTTLLAALAPQAVRFQGRISAHERVVDFTTDDHDCLAYAIGGTTNCKALAVNASLLDGHSATLPRIATAFMSGKGDLALTEFPFYLGGQAHWAIKGESQRWEVDNTPLAGVVKYLYDTVHRVWMR
jgi:hypothetical protein